MKKVIKINISTNYNDRDINCIGIGEAEYDSESNHFWVNTNFKNQKGEDDDMSISFDLTELLRVIGETIKEPCEY